MMEAEFAKEREARQGLRLVICGGGTGGHLFPGIAVADGVLARWPQSEIMFIGAGRRIDSRALAAKPYRLASLVGSGLKGASLFGKIKALALVARGLGQAVGLLRRFRPEVVLGVGGYVTGPVLLAARLLGIRTCIHEQNAIPGLTNRLLGRIVDRVFLSLPGSERFFPAAKAMLTGNPVRESLLAAREPAAALEAGGAIPHILVLGGSQGAHRVNMLMIEAVGRLAAAGYRVSITHQSGEADLAMVKAAYEKMGAAVRAEAQAFIEEMGAAYRRADLVVARAGATTLAELTMLGKAALLIPYPFAADDHQRANAEVLTWAGAARMALEGELTPAELADRLKELLADRDGLARMGKQAATLARPEAVAKIIDECLLLARPVAGPAS